MYLKLQYIFFVDFFYNSRPLLPINISHDLCREQAIAFIPVVAESLGGWHREALEQLHKLSSALARHTGQEESEKFDHLVKRVSILLQKGLASMLLNRNPSHPGAEIDGLM